MISQCIGYLKGQKYQFDVSKGAFLGETCQGEIGWSLWYITEPQDGMLYPDIEDSGYISPYV